jgi:H+/gluconate symporter-like permease
MNNITIGIIIAIIILIILIIIYNIKIKKEVTPISTPKIDVSKVPTFEKSLMEDNEKKIIRVQKKYVPKVMHIIKDKRIKKHIAKLAKNNDDYVNIKIPASAKDLYTKLLNTNIPFETLVSDNY